MRRRLSIGALVLSTAVARAQNPVPLPTSPAVVAQVDTIPVWERPQGALLTPGALTYTLSLHTRDGPIVSLGTRTVSVSEVAVGGTTAWLIAESRTGTAVVTTDSVLLRQSDLSPERWAATSAADNWERRSRRIPSLERCRPIKAALRSLSPFQRACF